MSEPSPPIPYASTTPQPNDLQHLNLLAIFHWIWGGLSIAFSFIFVIHIAMGIAAVNGAFEGTKGQGNGDQGFPPELGWIFIGLGSCAMLLGWTIGALNIYSGFCLKKHKRRTFCIVIAAIDCLSIPIGTTLGVFTMIVLLRDSVKQLYAPEAATHVTS